MDQIFALILTYKYIILLPLVMVGGPIIPVVAGSLASVGILNLYIVYVVAVLGTVSGDSIYYWIGRVGRHTFIAKYGHHLGVTEGKIRYAEDHYKNHLGKTLFFGKITEAAVIVILMAAGAAKVDFKRFLRMVTLIEVFKVMMFTLIGFYFGKYYVFIKEYLDTSVAVGFAVIVFGALVYWLFIRKKKKL